MRVAGDDWGDDHRSMMSECRVDVVRGVGRGDDTALRTVTTGRRGEG